MCSSAEVICRFSMCDRLPHLEVHKSLWLDKHSVRQCLCNYLHCQKKFCTAHLNKRKTFVCKESTKQNIYFVTVLVLVVLLYFLFFFIYLLVCHSDKKNYFLKLQSNSECFSIFIIVAFSIVIENKNKEGNLSSMKTLSAKG